MVSCTGYDKLRPEPIILYRRINEGYAHAEGLRLYGFDANVSVDFSAHESVDLEIANVSLLALPGTFHVLSLSKRCYAYKSPDNLATCLNDVIARPPLSDLGSRATFGLVQRWLQHCVQEHRQCRQILSAPDIDETVTTPSTLIFVEYTHNFMKVI